MLNRFPVFSIILFLEYSMMNIYGIGIFMLLLLDLNWSIVTAKSSEDASPTHVEQHKSPETSKSYENELLDLVPRLLAEVARERRDIHYYRKRKHRKRQRERIYQDRQRRREEDRRRRIEEQRRNRDDARRQRNEAETKRKQHSLRVRNERLI